MGERRIAGSTQSTTTLPGGERGVALPLVIASAVVLIVLLAGAVLAGRRSAGPTPPTPPPAPKEIPPTQPPAPSPVAPTPVGADVRSHVAVVEDLLRKGRYRQAMTMAEAALSIPELRAEDRRILTAYIVTAGMKDIYTHPADPLDREGEQYLVDTYLSLAERARGAGVAIDAPLQVAASAFASSQFRLAQVAIEKALAEGAFDPQLDRDVTRLYVSTLFGMGKWYTSAAADSPLYTEGVRWLVSPCVLT